LSSKYACFWGICGTRQDHLFQPLENRGIFRLARHLAIKD